MQGLWNSGIIVSPGSIFKAFWIKRHPFLIAFSTSRALEINYIIRYGDIASISKGGILRIGMVYHSITNKLQLFFELRKRVRIFDGSGLVEQS